MRLRQLFLATLCVGLISCNTVLVDTHQRIELQVSEPVKSASDTFSYRYMTLDNNLSVLLISDPDSPKAAASLDVMAGSGENPIDRGGLAHFLEHMLFMGTEKYPDVDDYERYILENGGGRNAYTSFEHTNYFFDIKAEALDGALDRFAQFFIAPLLDATYIEREKNAVEAEYHMGLKSDGRRGLDVIRELADKGHPYSRFTVGNLESLADTPEQSIRDDLVAFYEQYYSSQSMRLVVLGPQDLDTLAGMVAPRFTAIPDRGDPVSDVSAPLFASDTLPAVLTIEPVATQRELQLLFPVDDYRGEYRSKPLGYIGNLLGHEGAGSLLSYLKAQGLAESVGAGADLNWRGGSIFGVSIALSERGARDWESVVAATFAYIDVLKKQGPEAWRFAEQSELAAINFRFREDISVQSYVAQVANAMQYYAAEDVLQGPYLMDDFQPMLIQQALEGLSVNNVLIIHSVPDVDTSKVSQYYGVNYGVRSLGSEQLAEWQQTLDAAAFALPAVNPFIATDFQLTPSESSLTDKPVLLVNGERIDFWFRQDDAFKTPKGILRAQFRGADISNSPLEAVTAGMYVALVNDAANELAYPAFLAGLDFSISAGVEGIDLSVSGYNDKQRIFLKALQSFFAPRSFDQQRFDNLRIETIRRLENIETRRPYSQTMSDLSEALLLGQWSEQQRIEALKTLDLSQVLNFADKFWRGATIRALAYGNYSEGTARAMASDLTAMVGEGSPSEVTAQQVTKLLPGESLRLIAPLAHNDAVVAWYFQGPSDRIEDRAGTALSAYTTEQMFFNDLRTERQMGYVAASRNYARLKQPGWIMLVQSPSHSAQTVAAAMAEFKAHHLENLSEETFIKYRQSLVAELREPSKNVYEEGGRQWLELSLNETGFDTQEQMASAIERIEFGAWKQYFKVHFIDNPASLQVVAPGIKGSLPDQPATLIDSATAFRLTRQR